MAAGAVLKALADVVEHRLHGRAQLRVADAGDEPLHLLPQFRRILRRGFDEVLQHTRLGELLPGERIGAKDARRKTVLIVVGLRLDAHDGALGQVLEEIEQRAVAEAGEAERAGLVAELDGEIRVVVFRRLRGDLADQQHARERAAGARLERLEVADGHQGRGVGHAGIRSRIRGHLKI